MDGDVVTSFDNPYFTGWLFGTVVACCLDQRRCWAD